MGRQVGWWGSAFWMVELSLRISDHFSMSAVATGQAEGKAGELHLGSISCESLRINTCYSSVMGFISEARVCPRSSSRVSIWCDVSEVRA